MTQQVTHSRSRVINATPFYYGWVILLAGTLGTVMMGPSQTFTVGLFIDSFVIDLGVSRSNVSLLYGIATLSASLLLPLTGRLVDRRGPQFAMQLATVGMGLACVGMSGVQGGLTLLIGFFGIRFLGFGSMTLISNNLIAQWFVRRRGFVMGLAGQSLAISLLLYPPLGEFFIRQFGWRGAWIAFGVLVCIVTLPAVWLFFRDNPERYGLQPDGDGTSNAELIHAPVNEENWTLAEARRTGVFWLFAIGLSAMTMIMAGLVFHQASLFEARGLDRSAAVRAFQMIALFSVGGNLGMGQLLDKLSARLLLVLLFAVLGAAMVLVQLMVTPFQALIYAALLGIAAGSFRVLDATIWAKYFGRQHLGAIRGATMIGSLGATALGAYPLGLSYDYLGSYNPMLTALLLFPLGISLAAMFVSRPPTKTIA